MKISPENERLTAVIMGFLHANKSIGTTEEAVYWLNEAGMETKSLKALLDIERFLKEKNKGDKK